MKNKTNTGFTIVELLIVIVVIGILAAISIVAYNGIQQRAKNSQVIAGVRTYLTTIQQYAAVKTTYPSHSGCLGAGYPSNQCWAGDSGNHVVNATLDAQLAEFLSAKPTLATERFSIGILNNMRAGLLYDINASVLTPRIVYYLQGTNQTCLTGHTARNEGTVVTQCSYEFPAL